MMKAWINDTEIEFNEGETVLQAARRVGVFIPTLCAYLPLDHTPGTCRVCLVDVSTDGGKTHCVVTACTTPMTEGMRVSTRTAQVRHMQRMQVAWVFADHDQDCASCARHGNCELQDVALYVGLQHNGCNGRFTVKRPADWSASALVRDVNKCIRCGRCVEVCRQVQGIAALTMDEIGPHCGVGVAGAERWADSAGCVQCGQCAMVCPTGALAEKDETDTALDWFADPAVRTVVAFAPAVRVTLGDAFGLPAGENTEKRIVTALKTLGADYVCDINWAADVTIMEEGTELLERLHKGGQLPMMTSCCPGWVNYVEKLHPALLGNLSTTRSPQGIFGSLAKTWLAQQYGVAPENLRFISIMPCTAKKDEAAREQLSKNKRPDTDLVLTVREFARLLRRQGVKLQTLPESAFDSPFMSENTGAGAIFGVTGGVMEAAVRSVYHLVCGGELAGIDFKPVRGMQWLREAVVDLGAGGQVRLAVVHGLAHAEQLVRDIEQGRSAYDFIEVMACPGGCIDGGGTIRIKNDYVAHSTERGTSLYTIDSARTLRQSHNNPEVTRLYEEFLQSPMSEMAHELLHTHYRNRKTKAAPMGISQIWQKVKLG